jgi:hypothetical protein
MMRSVNPNRIGFFCQMRERIFFKPKTNVDRILLNSSCLLTSMVNSGIHQFGFGRFVDQKRKNLPDRDKTQCT